MLDSTLNTLIDGGAGVGGYLLSAVHSHIRNNAKNLHEERMSKQKNYESFVADTKAARNADSFISWTRRVIALAITLYLFSCLLAGFSNVPISYPIEHSFSLLGFHYNHTVIKTVTGFLYFPWFQMLMNLVAGFYFGRCER